MAVSQNLARLRSLLQNYAVTGVSDLSVKRLALEGKEAVSAEGWVNGAGGEGDTTTLSVLKPLSVVTTSAGSGSVTLPVGKRAGQIKYVNLGTQGGGQGMTLSCSFTEGSGTGLTASLGTARHSIGVIWDGASWQLLNSASLTQIY